MKDIKYFENENVVETKNCKYCDYVFEITDKDLEFLDKVSPIFNSEKIKIPPSNVCPECRKQKKIAWRNERRLYKRKCDITWENIISFISPDKKYPVYKREVWFSDQYEPTDYALDFDFSKTFSEQFKVLLDTVPRFSIQQQDPMENSDYCNMASNCKSCYMITDSDYCEKSLFSNVLKHSNFCIDCSVVSDSENCYELVSSRKCYNIKYSSNCIECANSDFLQNCVWVKDCFACNNLNNSSYCIFNKQYSKEEYFKIKEDLLKQPNLFDKIKEFHKKSPNKYSY